MPQIKPTSVQDLLKFIQDHRSDIENGTYDIVIEDAWVPRIPQDTILFLVKHCPGSRPALGRNINTPRDILAILARDRDARIRLEVAGNANVTIDVLTELAKDSDPDIRGRVAENGDTPTDVLATLAKDDARTHTEVQYHRLSVSQLVAYNQRAPQNVLSILARSTDPYTCRIVAVNSNISGDILAVLAKSVDPEARRCVARNPKTPVDILKVLARDTYNFSESGYQSPRLYIQEAIAKNLNTPPEVLDELSMSDNEDVRDCVASNTRGNVRKAAGGKKGCFIATAVYGSEFEPEVELLRNYRDRILANYKLGRLFIASYYAISPPVAHFIKPKRWIRNFVRCFILDPIVWIIRISCFR